MQKRDDAKKLLANGINPGEVKKVQKAAGKVEKNRNTWVISHADKTIRRFERDILPWIGSLPVSEIAASEIRSIANSLRQEEQ